MIAVAPTQHRSGEAFRHEALMYAGSDGFLDATLPFIRDGAEADEPTLVVVGRRKIDMLRGELGDEAELVHFADMEDVGTNPARIIPAWREFVADGAATGRRLRGVGEPIFPERSAAELVECHRHESLLNLAFADTRDFWLVCPYDTEALDPAVVEEARETHPVVALDGARRESPAYGGLEAAARPFDEPLPDPPVRPAELVFDSTSVSDVRRFAARHAAGAGLAGRRLEDLLLAVSELATNSVRHGGGRGLVQMWPDAGALVCEVRDGGRIDQPLVGRERPLPDQAGGFGLWLVNQVCELVQVRSFPSGGAVRMHMRLAAA